ncbi:hypothetical protein ACFWNU_26790, partial [Streptomyces sp. NPDC058427]
MRAADLTTEAAANAPTEGRGLYAGMRALPVPSAPVARSWHSATMPRVPLWRARRHSCRRAHQRHGGAPARRAGAGHPPAGVAFSGGWRTVLTPRRARS